MNDRSINSKFKGAFKCSELYFLNRMKKYFFFKDQNKFSSLFFVFLIQDNPVTQEGPAFARRCLAYF